MKKTQTTQRIFDVVRLVLEHADGLSHTEIQKCLHVPKSTLSGMLQELTELEILDVNAEQKYRVGRAFIQISALCVSQLNLSRELAHVLDTAGANEKTASYHAGILSGTSMVYLYEGAGKSTAAFFRPAVSVLPAHACALGKVLLAQKTDEQLRVIYQNYAFEQFTEETISSVDGLLLAAEAARAKGYATDEGELSPFVACMAVALPELDGLRAAVSATVPIGRFAGGGPAGLHAALVALCGEVTERMGVASPAREGAM